MKTLKSKLSISGNGLMSNVESTLEICPSSEKGIRFHLKDKIIEARVENVVSTEHCVVLANVSQGADAKVALVEHFMAACAVCGIDALDVYIECKYQDALPAVEIPILDGSSKCWVEAFNKTGCSGNTDEAKPLESAVYFQKGKSSVILLPSNEATKICYCVNFNHPDLKNRWASLQLDNNIEEIIEARTFGYLKDLEKFQAMGFSKGVTIENTVGLTDDGYTTELRSEFEPVKHKILDIIGDLYLTGINPLLINANILVKEAGHAFHVEAAKLLKNSIK